MVLLASCSSDTETEVEMPDQIEKPQEESEPEPDNTTLDTDNDGIADDEDVDDDGDGLIEVFSIDGLNAMRNNPNASGKQMAGLSKNDFIGFELTQDFDFENPDDYDDPSLLESYTTGKGWEPIGFSSDDSSTEFNGVFDGNGFTISNLYINNTEDIKSYGLIGVAGANSIVQNINLTNVSIITESFSVGGLIGFSLGSIFNCSSNGTITGRNSLGLVVGGFYGISVADCSSTGEVNGIDISVSESSNIGGLIGTIAYFNPGQSTSSLITVSNCYSEANITGDSNIGGLIGRVVTDSGTPFDIIINNSYATGNVSGMLRTGGLIGSSSVAQITSCFAFGDVTNNQQDGRASAGGLIGGTGRGTISSCYALGNVTNNFNGEGIGGLIGNSIGITIITSYSTGLVIGNVPEQGGFLGRAEGNFPSTISNNNYWDIETSALLVSGGDAQGLNTTAMQSPMSNTGIYATWDPAIWDFGTANQYPALSDMPNGLEAQR